MHVNGRENIDELLSRMEVIRGRLDEDTRAAKQSVQDMTDWRVVVGRYPIAAVAIVAAAGYFLVPKKVSEPQLSAEQLKQLSGAKTVIVTKEATAKPSLMSAFAAIAGAALTRAATSFVTEKVNQYATQNQNGNR